jgi:hypothetical protein
MGDPSPRDPALRRPLAACLAILCALESGALPALAAVKAAAAEAVSLPDALGAVPIAAPLGAPARRGAPGAPAFPDLLAAGVTAGRLRAAGRALVVDAPESKRSEVAMWVVATLEAALAGVADDAAAPAAALTRLRSGLPDLRKAETLVLPASASPAAVRVAQQEASRRIARLGLPDFSARGAEAAVAGVAATAPLTAAPVAQSARQQADIRERLGQKSDIGTPTFDELARFQAIADRTANELGPADPGGPSGADDARDAGWASLESLRRLFGQAGAKPGDPAPSGPPLPTGQLSQIETRVNNIANMKLRLTADLAQRDAAEGLLAVKARLRDDALAERRSGKDDLEFRKNFSRLAMVMDLSYSLNILNSADAALAKMQGLLDQKIAAITQQRKANDGAASAAAGQAANTDQWKKDAQAQAAADQSQSASFASLGGNVTKVGDAVAGFRADVPALLAMIDARDKGASANAVAEYDRRLALLPAMAQALKSGASNASGGVSSLSLAYLQAKSREVAGDKTLLAGADAKITAVPIEFAGALVVAVPGVPSETLSNPTRDQILALLARRRAFWQSQLDEHQSLLDSIQRAMDPANKNMTSDDFGSPQPESLVVWRANERSLDDQLAAAEAPMQARADADEAVIEAAGGGAALPRLSNLPPDDMRVVLPRLLDAMEAIPLPDTDAGFAAKAAHIDLARLITFLGDATARRLEARAVVAALDKPIGVILPKAHDAFKTAVAAWKAVLDDVSADEAYEKAGGPAAQAQSLIARKRALLSGSLVPALSALQDLLDQTLIPYQADRIAQSDPANTGDGYATLYAQKKKLYQQISDGLHLTLPWALASDGAKAYDVGAARAGVAAVRKTYDQYVGVVADYQDQMRRRQDPNENGTEDVYGETAPYSLVKRIAVYQAEKRARAAALNADAVQINDILGKMDVLDGGKHSLLAKWKLPTDLDSSSSATADKLNAMVTGSVLQNMAAAIKSVADAASAAGGAPSVSVGGGSGIPVGTQPPLDVSPMQKLALYGLEAIKRLVPSSASGAAGDSYAQSLARYLFADALVSSSKTYLTDRIPLFVTYLNRAKIALAGAEADLDADLAWVSGDRSGGDAVLARKAALFSGLAGVLKDGAALFQQKASWSASGVDTAVQAASYYNGLNQTYVSGNQALEAELSAAQQFKSALADSKSKIDSQRAEVVGWLGQLNSANESALNRVAQNISTIQDKTRAVLETNIAARQAERDRDATSASVESTLRALAAERAALDQSLGGVGDLSRLGPDLAARTKEAVGTGGAWIAESPSASTLVIPKGQLETFLGQLFSGLSSEAAASNIAALRADILKDPAALARLIPGSKVIPVGQGADGFYLVYQTEFSTPGGLETANSATLGNIAKLWGQNVSLIGYRFASPPSAGNAPFGDQGVTVRVESLDSDHAVNYLDVTFHKFLQDVPTDLGVAGQAQEARMMVFDDFALMLANGKVYFGAAGFADLAATDSKDKPKYYGGNLKTSVKFTQVLSLNASETALFASDPRKFLQTVNLDFTKYDPTLDQNFIISGKGENKSYRRDQVGVGIDLKQALKQKDAFMLDVYYAHVAGTDDVNQSLVGATILKGFTFDFLGQKSKVTVGGGVEVGQKQDDFNGRVSYELPDQGIALSLQGKYIGTGSAYYAQLTKKMGDHSTAAISYGSPYIGLNNRAAITFSSSYTLGELWRAVTGQAASDLSGGKALADFDKALSDFFTRSPKDAALVELKKVFDADVGRQLAALEIGKLSREIETLTKAGALLDNTKQSAMVGFVSNPIGSGTAERATGGGFQVGTRTDLTLTKTQRALIESKTATLFSLGLDLEERLLDLTKAWQQSLAELAQARWRELLAGWLAAHADDPVLRAEAEADAAAAADQRRQAELKYDALTGRGPDDVPAFDGVSPQDFDVLLDQVAASLARADRVGALLQRARGRINLPQQGLNIMDWIPWVEKLSFTVGAQLPDVLSSQPLGIGLTITLPVYDPTRGRNDAAMLLQQRATMMEMAGRLRQTRLRAHGERLSARAWAERAADAASQEKRLAAELSDGIRQYRNALIEASDLRARARRWRDAVSETLSARVNASLESAWASLDDSRNPESARGETYDTPTDMKGAFDQAARTSPNWEALALRSQAAAELLAASDRRVRKVDVDLNLGSNLTATGLALLPVFGITGLSAMPIVGVQLAPEELRQLDVARTGAEAGLYARLRDKAAADAALGLTRATIDASWLDRQQALYRDQLLPGLEAAQDGSAAKALELSEARAAYADLAARRRQATAAMNQMLGRPLDSALSFAPDTGLALAAFAGRAAALDPVAAARDALASRVKIARAVEVAVDKHLKVDQLRLEPISLIGQSLGRLVSALSGDAVGSPELMALARERTLDAERALEAYDAEVPAVRARLAAQLSAVIAQRAALSGKTDAGSRLQDLELGRNEDLLLAQLEAWGGAAKDAADGALPSSYADLEDRLRQAEERATFPSTAGGDSGAIAAPGAVEMQGNLRWYDARQTLAGDPIGRQFMEGWVEARLRSASTPPEALAMLADLREKAADERRRLDAAGADARAELLLSRLRLGAGLLRWSEGVGLGADARSRVAGDLAEAAALLHLPANVKPERLLDVMPVSGDGDLASVSQRYLDEAEALDFEALGRTLFLDGLPQELSGQSGRDRVPELRADLIAEKMSSRGFTPLAAFGMFRGQWVSGAFLEAPKPEQIQDSLTSILDDALRNELESRDRLKSLGLLIHSLMASVADKTRLVAAARLRETLARRALGGTLERVRLRMTPVSEAAAAAAEAQAAQESFVSALYALREDFARLTTELTALGIKPAPTAGGAFRQGPASDEPVERTAREKLLAYWSDRMQDPDFERHIEELLVGQPESVRAALRDLSARYRAAARDADAVRSNDFTPVETLELLTKTDVQGRRRAIEEVLTKVLSGLQAGDAAHSASWTSLMDFLRDDVTARAATTGGSLDRADRTRRALRATFWDALGGTPAQKAEMVKLEDLQTRTDAARRQALAAWLARETGVQDHVLKDKALNDYVTALDAFDAEMASALSSKAASDAGWARTLDGLYGVRESLARRGDRLRYGRGLLTIDAAISLDESRLRALRFSPDETRDVGPASESLAYLRALRQKWTGRPDAIPALVALRGKDGDAEWATVEDLAKAKLAGRVATIGGRRFLKSADAIDTSPKDADAALAQGWREVIEGEDAARERLSQARARREAAAREAALTVTLNSSEVALAGGAAGGGAVRTSTVAELRALEASGRALWFEAAPDPRTGLRGAVPAVAARWRDPAELILLVLDSGAAPASGRYPTYESLLASPDAKRFSRGRIGAAGLGALEREASAEALAARREGWLKLKLNAWGFALDASGEVAAVYLTEDELRKAAAAAADPKDPGHAWRYLRADAVALGLSADGTVVAVRAGDRTIVLGDGTPLRWISQTPLALETDAKGRVTRLFLDKKELDRAASGWSFEDAQGRTWQGGDALPPLLRARRWTDPATGLTVALGRDLLAERRDAAKSGQAGAGRWGYMPAQWPGLITEIPRGIISTPIEIATGRDPNQQGYLGRVNARRGEGGATVARGALGSVLRTIDLFGLMNDPVDRYFDPSQYPDSVRRDSPLLPGASAGDAGLRSTDGKKNVFYGAGSFAREAGWAQQDLEASRAEVLAAFRGGVRRETTETLRGRAGDYADSTVGLNVGLGAALAAISDMGSRLDSSGGGRVSDSPHRAAVDKVDTVVQIVAGAQTQDARIATYEKALAALKDAAAPDASDAEIADAEAALSSALAARRAANAALMAAKPSPNLPGYPALPQLYASLRR